MADRFIKVDELIIAIDKLINDVPTATEAKLLFKVKDIVLSQRIYFDDERLYKRGVNINECS